MIHGAFKFLISPVVMLIGLLPLRVAAAQTGDPFANLEVELRR